MKDNRFVLLHPEDNIFVCCQQARKGEVFCYNDEKITLNSDIDVGHKLARVDLKIGDKIIKYGAPIGSSKQTIAQGDHIHLHNMKSDYISSHTREKIVEDN